MDDYKIAVIDSGICPDDAFINNAQIVSLDSNGKYIYSDISNMHGTYVVRLLSREIRSPVNIISIKILDERNKGTLKELCNALKLCMDMQVKIINISLGFLEYQDTHLQEFIKLCELSNQLGMVIIAAYNNDGTNAYPALLPYVIGVSANNKQQYPLYIDRKARNISFFHNYIIMPEQHSNLVKGNSYLAPLITGLFYKFAINNELDADEFLQYLSVEYAPCLQNKYWVNNINDIKEQISSRKITFLMNTRTKTNSELLAFLKSNKYKNQVSVHFGRNIFSSINDDTIFFSDLEMTEKNFINSIYDFSYGLANSGKDIIMLTPYITMWDRIAISHKFNNKLISVYF